MSIVGYILTVVGIGCASWGAGDTLAMALNRKPVMSRLIWNDAFMLIGTVVAAMGVVLVLAAEPGTLALT